VYGLGVSRTQKLLVYGFWALAVVVLFAVFIGFKKDAALVAALSAAGTVAAAGFAAVAAMGSMRAAAESSATARRSRETLARTAQPRVTPSVVREDGTLHGRLNCGGSRAAVDVQVAWMLAENEAITDRVARIEPGASFTVDLKAPDTGSVLQDVSMVWLEYWDDSHVGLWRDTWRPDPDVVDSFLQTDSDLAD
jgi:hypothetical protein